MYLNLKIIHRWPTITLKKAVRPIMENSLYFIMVLRVFKNFSVKSHLKIDVFTSTPECHSIILRQRKLNQSCLSDLSFKTD